MNNDTIQGNWKQLKGKAKQQWAKLGDIDLGLLAEGKEDEFAGKIQEVYGKSREDAEKEINDFKKNCGCGSSSEAA